MRIELVAVDLETTGLNVDTDAIIEIGAVRFRDGQVLEEFSTLINPGFAIPMETTYITGIQQEDLRHAPTLKDVLPKLNAFVGNAPIVAHNASFDVAFLRRFGAIKDNLPIDTIELATILLPRMPRYGLGSLTAMLGIELEQAHRALDDTRATAMLYWKLWEKTIQLPYNLLQEIAFNAKNLHWELAPFFDAALVNHVGDKSPQNLLTFAPFKAAENPIEPKAVIHPLDTDRVHHILDQDGALAQTLERYEHREEQLHMLDAVVHAFNQNEHLMVEAGTGTGKSLAYLVPAIEWAIQNHQRVVIATNTINLQEQLLHKDVPMLQDALKLDLSVKIMKGRSNYLCPRRIEAIRRRRPTNLDELRLMSKLLIWMQESTSGDKGEITLRGNEHALWARLSADDEGCSTHRCEAAMQGICPFYKARKHAETAHIVIANHALLISDAISENRVLPEYKYLIVDEAHQLEEAITSGLSLRVDQVSLLRRLGDLGGLQNGLLGDLLHSVRGTVSEKQLLRLEAFIQDIGDALKDMTSVVKVFYSRINEWIGDLTKENSAGSIRVNKRERDNSHFAKLQDYWKRLDEYFEVIVEAMGNLIALLNKLEPLNIPSFDDHLNGASAFAKYFGDIRRLIHDFINEPDSNTVYWIESYSNPEFTAIQSAPLHIGTLMHQYLWDTKSSVIMTSATLETNSGFDYIKERLSADTIKTITIGSPFNYQESTLLYIPQDMPEPTKQGYQQAVERGIIELTAALEGRVLVLFTSYSQLRETATNISPRLALGNITVLDQAIGGSREALLEGFRSTKRAVLLGTKSFWQGVDLPGDDLLGLIIVKIPFAVPSDPIFAARSETYRNSFDDFAVPDTMLRFRQGFGRLIRTRSDKGIVSIFDSRIIHKGYGKTFLESLPDCTLKYGALSGLASSAKTWLSDRL